ncbi:MAG TPA: RNA polymerase sigma factor [Streptosporangiaceae bacterium]|jgi:RNA polymerase sigma-70 factor (ECF subfamily)
MDRAENLGVPSAVELVPRAREPARGAVHRAGRGGAAASPGVADLADAIRRARDGDEEAFRILYRDLQPRFLRYLRAIVGDDAEDVASETWLHIARGLTAFQGDSDGFRGWTATIARNRATDHLRQRGRRLQTIAVPVEELTHVPGTDDTAGSALDAMSTAAAVALIARLPPDQGEAVLLRTVMGLDAAGAGRVLGKRPGAVRTAAYRGLRKLADFLEQ